MAENGVIGRAGAMPWHVPSDLKRYRRLTMGKPMIMGRKTLESIGRVLDGRDTIVLTRSPTVPFEGAIVADSPEAALTLARERAKTRGTDEIVIAGGGEIYRAFMDRLDRLLVTQVDAAPEGDAFFPPIDPGLWEKVLDEPAERGERDSAPCRFIVFERRVARAASFEG
ncbi:diacylglycerol kinase [Aurantimonas aggregata]|uniref:Dihydrofolate reductase n=2 Tax=Aurantimonas aggregata TaxID=2047720 RepID=A0A6L9MCX1_9HYPH|nr:diacylglycerol kinase [Aurantimonas aggregata]